MKGKGHDIVQEIHKALQVFEYHEMASHPLGDQYGAILWTVRCLANPDNFERWLKPIIEQAKPDLTRYMED